MKPVTFCGYRGTGSDITEQFHDTEEMKWAEMLLRSLFETSMIRFVLHSPNSSYRERMNAGF
jgi:hypothetical protein